MFHLKNDLSRIDNIYKELLPQPQDIKHFYLSASLLRSSSLSVASLDEQRLQFYRNEIRNFCLIKPSSLMQHFHRIPMIVSHVLRDFALDAQLVSVSLEYLLGHFTYMNKWIIIMLIVIEFTFLIARKVWRIPNVSTGQEENNLSLLLCNLATLCICRVIFSRLSTVLACVDKQIDKISINYIYTIICRRFTCQWIPQEGYRVIPTISSQSFCSESQSSCRPSG